VWAIANRLNSQDQEAIGDWFTVLIAILSLLVLIQWKVSNPVLIAVTAAAGFIAYPLIHPGRVMVK
jgi:chromate transporter